MANGRARPRRVVELLMLLRHPEGRTVAELAKTLGVGTSTVYRDLELVQQAGFVLDRERGWHADKRRVRHRVARPPLDLDDPANVSALAAAIHALAAFEGTEGYRNVIRALGGAPRPYDIVWAVRARAPDTAVMAAADEALRENRALQIRYLRNGETLERTIEPLRMVVRDGVFYVHAWEDAVDEAVLVRLSRVLEATIGRRRRKDPNDHPAPPLAGGAWLGEPVRFRLRFAADVASHAADYDYGNDQTCKCDDHGRLIVEGTATGLPPLLAAVLGWGSKVEVLEPDALRTAWIEELRAAVRVADGQVP